jgi:tetratricopeptide (TPR) repeat protein
MSCETDAIIFTNGDNDTFPLWYLQEVENVRKDVRVINLSLVNTDWYILQLKHQMGVPIELTDKQIIWQPYERRGQIQLYRPEEPYYDPVRKRNRYLTATQDPQTGKITRVQDQMIEHIVIANKNRYPIYFSTSVPASNRWTLSDYTIRQAMVLKILLEKPEQNLDPVTTENLLYNVYRYRGVGDVNVFKDENNVGLTSTYPERFIELSNYYRQNDDDEKANQVIRDAIERFPFYYQNYIELMEYYGENNQPDSVDAIYRRGVEKIEAATTEWPDITLFRQFLGVLHFENRDYDKAIACYEKSLEMDPSSSITFKLLLQLYNFANKRDKATKLLDYWMKIHPEDMEARNLYNIFKRYNQQQPG